LTKKVVDYLEYEQGVTAADAAKYGVDELNSIKAEGGQVCIDRDGNVGFAHNTQVITMYCVD